MKTSLLALLIVISIANHLFAQCDDPPTTKVISGNGIEGLISNGGDLFFDGDNGIFYAPAEVQPLRSTIYVAGLWLGGYDAGGNLKLSAQTYGRNYAEFDFTPGPLKPETGENFDDHCTLWNKIWVVEKQDVLDHIADFADNGVIDNPIPSIYAWPGHNTVHSYFYNGFILPYSPQKWAPFFDNNNNGNYDPESGDYPHPDHVIDNLIPEQISWTVFNDNITHQETGGDPLKVEVQLTSWNFDCLGNHVLTHSLFTSHKIINRSQEVIDSMSVGLWVDFNNGCHLDDYIGCSPENNGFLAYNSDALDGASSANDCAGVETYGKNPPAQSVAFLNRSLDKFIFHNPFPACVGPPGEQYPPSSPIEYYNYLRGRWNDGTPLTFGGSGYQATGGDPTNWVFPDNPNDSLGWSLFTLDAPDGDRRALGSTYVGELEPGEVFKIDMAHTFHGYPNIDYLESADQAFIELAQIQQMYDMKFNSWCNDIIASSNEVLNSEIEVFPNPSDGKMFIKSELQGIERIELFDQLGTLIFAKENENLNYSEIDFSNQAAGIYLLKIRAEGKNYIKKIFIY